MRVTPSMAKARVAQFREERLLNVAAVIAQGFAANPGIDWESDKTARTAVQFAKDLIHEVETTEII